MIKSVFSFLLFTCMIFIYSCKVDEPIFPQNFIFPLETGNSWGYETQITFSSADTNYTEFIISFMKISGEETLSNSAITKIVYYKDSSINGSIFENTQYYSNQSDGLYLHAYILGSGPRVFLKAANHYKYLFHGKLYDNINEIKFKVFNGFFNFGINRYDSLIIEQVPLKTIAYPIRIGDEWVYRSTGNPFGINKKVSGKELIETPAGKFQCIKVEFFHDINNFVFNNMGVLLYLKSDTNEILHYYLQKEIQFHLIYSIFFFLK